MKKICVISVALLLGLTMVISAGGSGESGGSAAAPKSVKIVLSAPFTGTGTVAGEWIRAGIQMAADEINAKGGILGAQIELAIYDDQGNPSTATTVIRKAISDDKAVAIFGPNMSSAVVGVHQLAQQAKIPMLVGATSPSFGYDKVRNDYLFRLRPDDGARVSQLVKYLVETLKIKKPGIIYGTTDYCTAALAVAQGAFKNYNIPILITEQIKEGDKDATAQITKMKNAGIDVVVGLTHEPEAAAFITQSKQLGLNVPMTGFSAWAGPTFMSIAGAAGDGVIASQGWIPEVADAKGKEFTAGQKAKYPKLDVGELNQCYYDGLYFLKAAIEKAGSFEGEKIAKALMEIEYQGVMHLKMDAKHNGHNTVFITKSVGNTYELIAKVE
jgi:branched-chain amino acid transport system substrate-binding protein